MNFVQKLAMCMLFFFTAGLVYANHAVTASAAARALNIKCPLACYQKEKLLISTFKKYPLSLTVSEIVKSAYAKLGVEVEVRYLPGKRSLHYSNTGHADGELFRIQGIDHIYPNLVRIPVAIMELETIAYAKRTDIVIDGWASLTPYKIGFLRGFRKAEDNTQGMHVYSAEKMSSLFNLLVNGRVDLVIESRIGGKNSLDSKAYAAVMPLEPPITKFKIFHYVHRENKSLVPGLTKVLREMEASGELQKIIDDMIERDFSLTNK